MNAARRITLGVLLASSVIFGPASRIVADVRLAAVPDLSLHASPEGPGFRGPTAVSVDLFGQVFVADTGNHRVVHFDSTGRLVRIFGDQGWGVGEFSGPSDVCAREGFRLFVVDEGNERIQEFDIGDSSPEGAVFPFREAEGLAGEDLVRPFRMDLDAEGRIYVSDSLCHCVWIFSPTGQLVERLGEAGSAPGQFRSPAGVAVGPGGRVHVADAGNARIQVFDSIGNWIAAWGGPATDPLSEPTGIDVDAEGNLWIADPGLSRVRVFTADGGLLFDLGGAGDGPGRFRAPVDVALDPDGSVWVVDEIREVVERFRIERVPGGE